MGSVDLARALSGPRAGEIVAVKRLHPHLEREKHFADMFFDEAFITAGLHHPNVVEIFDWGQDSQGRYLALEFVAGDSLLTLIRESKKANVPIPIDLALYIVGKTAEGLHAAHELRNEKGELRHLVHRDVTPSNILISLRGDVKLIDFGVAKARDRLSHTSTGTIKGKFGYMSPEQARGFPIDRRSDVFSLGIVLWEVLALKRLYRSESELEILRMIVEDPPPSICEARPEVPRSLENLVTAALAKNRDDRLGSCAEFADFIWAVYDEQGYTAGSAELAAFFRRVMPERCQALEQLLAGGAETIEPTITCPASGSVSGAIQAHQVSGAMPIPAPTARPPAGTTAPHPAYPAPDSNASILATAYPAPASAAPAQNRRGVLMGVLAGIGVMSLIVAGWALTRQQPARPATSAPVTAAANVPAAAPPVQAPAPGPAAATAQAPALPPANTETANTGTTRRTTGRNSTRTNSAVTGTASGITREQVERAMLVEPPMQPSPPARQDPSAQAHHDPPPRQDPPTQPTRTTTTTTTTATSATSGTSSGSSGSSGTTGSNGSNESSGSNGSSGTGGRIRLNTSW
jgi:serine/threonine-protein kinase